MAVWGNYNLPAIWKMIERENSCTGADRVLSWQGLAESVQEQRRRLMAARDELAAAWPPESNTSARVFLEKVDLLAAHMEHTLTSAENTRVGLNGVIGALAEAQSTIRPLLDERQAANNDVVPRFVDHAEDKYDEMAQRAMAAAEQAISEHSAQIQAPTLYELQVSKESGNEVDPNDSRTSAGNSGASGAGTHLRASPTPVAVPHEVLPALVGGEGGSSRQLPDAGSTVPGGSSSLGPGLAGVAPLAPTVPPTAGAAGLPPSVIGPGGGGGMPVGGLAAGVGMGVGMPGAMIAPGARGPMSGKQPVSIRRAMPSGAVIGPANPAGAAGSRGAASGPFMTAAPSRADGNSDNEVVSTGKADQAWEVETGVASVIKPDIAQPSHDPGPGVIGRDR